MKSTKLLDNWSFTGDNTTVTLSIPHDFMIGTARTADSPTCADYGYFQPCKGTYTRKITRQQDAKKHFVKFDGVMGLTQVFINDNPVVFHPYGYTSFVADIGDYLHDGENELRVNVDAMSQPASRWYTGAGIYREVELLTSDKDYIIPDGIAVKVVSIDGINACVDFETDIMSEEAKEATLTYHIPEIDVSIIRHIWLDKGTNHYSYRTVLKNIECWSVENPILYTCEAKLATIDSADTSAITFGIRTVVCTEDGLLLNGKVIKLYGTCNHHDNGIIGAASYRSAEERRVRIIKENGFNAIRTSHNPPSSMLLDVCDRMGMLVIDEIFDCWENEKRPYDYHLWFDRYAKEDIVAWVKRDRNHPCVIMWSTGNEIFERSGFGKGYHIGKMIADTIKANDITRPITHALCYFWEKPEYGQLMLDTFKEADYEKDFWINKIKAQSGNLDVLGYNYLLPRLEKDEKYFADHLFIISESYACDAVYAKREMDKRPQLTGEFVWTGWDYFGETGLGHIVYEDENAVPWGLTQYPDHISNCGDFDICGFKKSPSYYRDAAWKPGSVHILTQHPDNFGRKKTLSQWGFYDVDRTWTYTGNEGKNVAIYLFTTAYECELKLNGKSLGKKTPDEKGIAIFDAEYIPGRLEAFAYDDKGNICGNDSLSTTQQPAKIVVKPDLTGQSGDTDMYFAEVYLCDENGMVSWEADNLITVTVTGGQIIGTGNGKIDDLHNYTSNVCNAYHGKMLVAIKPEGKKTELKLSVAGLQDAVIQL